MATSLVGVRDAVADRRVVFAAVLCAAVRRVLGPRAAAPFAAALAAYIMLRLQRVQRAMPGGRAAAPLSGREGEKGTVLYHNCFSLCSGKVRLCLAEKGITYKEEHVHLVETGGYGTQSRAFLRVNPGATVPVLVHDGHPVYESHDIIRYIDTDLGPPGSLSLSSPADAASRAAVERWVDSGSLKGSPLSRADREARLGTAVPLLTLPLFCGMVTATPVPWAEYGYGFLFHFDMMRPLMFAAFQLKGAECFRPGGPPFAALVRAGRDAVSRHLAALEAHLAAEGGPYVCGATYTLADVGLTTIFERLRVGGWSHLFASMPRVAAYWRQLRGRPSYAAAFEAYERPCITRAAAQVERWKEDPAMPWFARDVYGIAAGANSAPRPAAL